MQASEILALGGPVERLLDGYESRPQQVEMAAAVERALTDKGILVVEAGTGTGKSLAYLIPLALHALETKQPVVISSSTHVLQDQLITKDIGLHDAFASAHPVLVASQGIDLTYVDY